MKLKVIQIKDGESNRYFRRKNGITVLYTACCDCGLVHFEEFKSLKHSLRIRVWRDEKRTKLRRELLKKEKTKSKTR